MKKHNTFEIGAPCSPSSFFSKKTEKCLKIAVSAGGGMGGSFWYEYGTTKDDVKNGGFITIKDAITKQEKQLNTNFIVKVEEVQVAKVVWDTTQWANYNRKVCGKQTQTLYYWFPIDAKVSFSYSYKSNEDLSKNLIKKIVEEE